jgi:hypothetical protein
VGQSVEDQQQWRFGQFGERKDKNSKQRSQTCAAKDGKKCVVGKRNYGFVIAHLDIWNRLQPGKDCTRLYLRSYFLGEGRPLPRSGLANEVCLLLRFGLLNWVHQNGETLQSGAWVDIPRPG